MSEGTLVEISDGEETFHFTIAEYRTALAKVGLRVITQEDFNVLNSTKVQQDLSKNVKNI